MTKDFKTKTNWLEEDQRMLIPDSQQSSFITKTTEEKKARYKTNMYSYSQTIPMFEYIETYLVVELPEDIKEKILSICEEYNTYYTIFSLISAIENCQESVIDWEAILYRMDNKTAFKHRYDKNPKIWVRR